MGNVEKIMKNLVSLNQRPKKNQRKIHKMGVEAAKKSYKKIAHDKAKRKPLVEVLKNIIFLKAKTKDAIKKFEHVDCNDDAYFTALSADVMPKGIEKMDVNYLEKLMKLPDKIVENSNSEEDEAFNNLIEAVKNVRKSKRKPCLL